MTSTNLEWMPMGHNEWCSVALSFEKFYFRVNRGIDYEFDTFDQAADYNIKLMYKNYNDRPLYVSMSGGIDSELVANILLRNNIKFTPYIFKIEELNHFESWYADYWCYQNNIKPVINHITLSEYENIFQKYFKKIKKTHQIGIINNLYIADEIEKLGGYCITGLGDVNQDDDGFFCNAVDYGPAMFNSNCIHPPGFFVYTPEIMYSYIKQFDPALNEQYNKLSFYNLPARPKTDYISTLLISSKVMIEGSKLSKVIHGTNHPHRFGSKQDLMDLLKGI